MGQPVPEVGRRLLYDTTNSGRLVRFLRPRRQASAQREQPLLHAFPPRLLVLIGAGDNVQPVAAVSQHVSDGLQWTHQGQGKERVSQ